MSRRVKNDPERRPVHEALEARLGYSFEDRALLERALTHRSYANENGRRCPGHNERMEFLGDAVLDLVISERLMSVLPDADEGTLTRMRAAVVNETVLSGVARRREIGDALLLGRGEDGSGGREKPSLLADAYEAVLAAVYLDGGLEPARKMVLQHLRSPLTRVVRDGGMKLDFKTRLQERLQNARRGTPRYVTVAESGPAHNRVFTVEIQLSKESLGRGRGRSKKDAAQAAAKAVLRRLDRDANGEKKKGRGSQSAPTRGSQSRSDE